jgi:cobaltochelatase CobS
VAINVTQLTRAHIASIATRAHIHKLTNTPEGPTMAQRAAFAAERGVRNITKYWDVPTVLAACDLWAIVPVLGRGGSRYVRKNGGLTFSREGREAPPRQAPPQEERPMSKFSKPKVFVGSQPQPQPQPQGDNDAERQRKLLALQALVRQEIEAARGKDDEALKDLIAGVSQAAAGAVLDTKGRALLDNLKAEGQALVAEAIRLIDEARPVVLEVRTADRDPVVLKGNVHAAFRRVIKLAAQRKNIALIGPTGCGKTHLAAQVADALGLQYATQSVTMGMSESKIAGGLLPTGEAGRFEPFIADYVRLFRDGGVFLLDEWDAADPNVALVVNQSLANGHMDLPLLGAIRRHPDFICIAAMNTYGTGADRQYVGRSQLDEASLDRFRIGQVEMDYDRSLEKLLVGPSHAKWLERAWQVRDAIRASRLRRNMSTRFILDARDMIRDQGDTVEQVLTAFSLDWSPDERAKVGITPVALY